MAKTNVSDYRFSIFINNDQAKRSLVEMEKVMQGYEAELQKLIRENKKDSDEYRKAKKVHDDHLESMKKMRQEAGLQALSLKELRALRAQLNNEMARVVPGAENWKKLQSELGAVNERIATLQNGAKQTGMTFGKLADGFNRYFGMITAGVAAFTGLAFSIKGLITTQADLDDSLANIRKSTGMTADEVKALNAELGKINTRTSRQELREMSVVAGQLGVAKEDIFAFVESVDRLNVALGDEFTGGAEEVAKQMGMMRNVLSDMKTGNIADDMMHLGNAINTLGAAGFATGPVMADFASRIGGVGIPLGLTSDEVLGLSATLQELNVNAERGGTAVVKIMQKMTTNTEAFASVAGMPIREFTDLVNTDLYGAFLKVIEGSNRGGGSATALAGIIKDLEIAGVGASEIFAKLGKNTEMLAEKTSLAGKSLQGTDSITAEFNIKNATLGATLAKLQKDFYGLITMPGITNFFKDMVYGVVQLVNVLKDLPLIIEKYRIALIAVVGAMAVWIAAKTRSLQVSMLHNLTFKEGILLKAKDAIVMQYLIVKEELLTIVKGKGTVATKLATVAQYLWNAAVKANPLGILITAITAVVGAIAWYNKNNAEAIALDKAKARDTVLLRDANNKLEASYAELQGQMGKMNTMSQQEKKNLQETLDLKIKNAQADLLAAEARQKAIGKQAAQPTFWQGIKASLPFVDTGASLMESSLGNTKEAIAPFDEGIKNMRDNLNKLKTLQQDLNNVMNAESNADKIVAKTQEALSEKLSQYQTALRQTVAGSEEYHRIQNKIKETNKDLAKFNTDSPSGSKQRSKKLKTEYEKLTSQINDLSGALKDMVSDDPEQAALMAKKIARLKHYKQALDEAITSLQQQADEENAPLKKMPEKEIFGKDKKHGGLEKPPEKLEYSTNFEELYQFRKEFGFLTADEIADYEIKKLEETRAWAIASEEEKAEAIKKINEDAALSAPNNIQQWAGKANEFINNYFAPVVNMLTQIDQLMSQQEANQLARDKFQNDEKKKNLKRQLDAKKITQKQYDDGILKLDEELDAKKRDLQVKQAKRQKALSLAQAIMNVAGAVASALNTQPFILGIIMAVLAAALGAVQISNIINTPIPEAAKGRYKAFQKYRQAARGRYDVIGESDNKMYSGVPYMESPPSGVYGQPTLFAETGREIILNPKHTENLMRFRPDLVEAIMSVPQRAVGLYPARSSSSNIASQPLVVGFDQETLQEMRLFREGISKPLQSNIVYDQMIDAMDTVDEIKRNVAR